MRRRRGRLEDPLTYRIAYSRIAQELHAWSLASPETAELEAIPAAGVRKALERVQREVPAPEPAAASAADAPDGLAGLAEALIEESRDELLRLGCRWVGQRRSRLERLLPWRRWRRADPRLASFLACVVEPATVAIYFSIRVEEGWIADFAPEPLEAAPVDRRTRGRGQPSDDWLRSYLEFIRQPEAEISYRARYNLACLFSRTALQLLLQRKDLPTEAPLAEATRQLELCVGAVSGRRRAAIQAWAWQDPAFIGLKELRWKEFGRILGPPPQ